MKKRLISVITAFGIALSFIPSSLMVHGADTDGGPELKFTPADMYGGEWKSADGYYLFVWQASEDSDAVFDTTAAAKPIATLIFTLKGDADEIAYNSFSVMPWHKTPPALAYAETLPADDADFAPLKYYNEYWRYTDE